MTIGERADTVVATSVGQTVGWVLILAIVLGFFSQTAPNVSFLATVIALGLSWMLGASYGRRQAYDRAEQDEQDEQTE